MSNNSTSLATTASEWFQYLSCYIPYLFLGSWSIAANLFMIIVIAKDKSLREKHQLIISLATGDLFIGFAILTSGTARLIFVYQESNKLLVSHIECFLRPWNPFFMIGYQFSALVTIIISLERLACVSAPIRYYQLPSKLYIRVAVFLSGFYVIISLGVGFFTSYNLPNLIENMCMTSDTFSSSYALYNYTICAFSGLTTVAIYVISMAVMRLNIKRVESNSQAKFRLIAQYRVTNVMAIVLAFQFILVALPNLGKMTAIIADIRTLNTFWPYLSHAAVANSCLTIVIYAFFISELRTAFRVAVGLKSRKAVTNLISFIPSNFISTRHRLAAESNV